MAATAATLAVLCTLVTLALLVATRHVVWIRREPDLFRCKIRVTSGWLPGYSEAWPRRANRAVWARDVLIIFRGIGGARTTALPVAHAHGDVHTFPHRALSRLGAHPVALDLVLDDGSRLEVAAPAEARTLLCGPYVVPQVQPDRNPRTNR